MPEAESRHSVALVPLAARATTFLNGGLFLVLLCVWLKMAALGLFWRADFTAFYTGWRMVLDGIRALDGPRGAEARAWITAVDREGPLSFQNLCEALGVDPDALRAGVSRGRTTRPPANVIPIR